MNESKKQIALKIAKNLKMIRAKKNVGKKRTQKISQEKLSEMSGVSLSTITGIESASYMPNIYTLVCIARALDVKLTELLEGVE